MKVIRGRTTVTFLAMTALAGDRGRARCPHHVLPFISISHPFGRYKSQPVVQHSRVMKKLPPSSPLRTILLLLCCASLGRPVSAYHIYVTNEKSGDVSAIDGATHEVLATIPVGKRPRGIRVSPDSKTLFVAVSGTPISAPPQLDAKGNPIFKKGKDDDDDDDKKADKSADGIAIVDIAEKKFLRKIQVGSDPEQLALSADGTRLFVSNEDVGTASVVNIASGKVEHIIPVSREPEGVGTTPSGKEFT